MKMIIATVASLAFLSCVAGCDKDKGKDKGGAPTPPAKTADAAAAAEPVKPIEPVKPPADAPPPPASVDGLAPAKDDCDKESCAKLGLSVMQTDAPRAMSLFLKSCQLDNQVACAMVAMGYESGRGVAVDTAKALQYYEGACKADYTKACHNLGMMYGQGTGVALDLEKAKIYLKKACDLGDQRSCQTLEDNK